MTHCPQCGMACEPVAPKCTTCGLNLALVRGHVGAMAPVSRTILGGISVHDPDEERTDPEGFADVTIADAPRNLNDTLPVPPPSFAPTSGPNSTLPMSGAAPTQATLLGIAPSAIAAATQGLKSTYRMTPDEQAAMSKPAGATLLGVARPGIAPLRPGVAKTPSDPVEGDPPSYFPAEELGATYVGQRPNLQKLPDAKADASPRQRLDKAMRIPVGVRKQAIAQADKRRTESKRGLYIIAAAAILVVAGVLVVLFLPSSAPLSAQVRAAEGGQEVLDVKCTSCPDGTTLKLGPSTATMKSNRATLTLESALAIGDTPLQIAVDRPDRGRDETVTIPVRVAYRIRPDLATLQADRPAIQIVVEAMSGAKVSLDGEDVPLRDGRAVHTLDVTKDLTGLSSTSDLLTRKVAYEVVPPDGVEEKGVVSVSVAVVPLLVDAPGSAVVLDRATFVLAGRTLPGAQIAVAGRPIDVGEDGSFARTMNVSSVGATQIEVRAKMDGKAPRLTRIAVERTQTLDGAAREFPKRNPISYDDATTDLKAAKGRWIDLRGEVVESKQQAYMNTFVLRRDPCGTASCLVRVSVGAPAKDLSVPIERGKRVRVFGVVSGDSELEIEAAFMLGGS